MKKQAVLPLCLVFCLPLYGCAMQSAKEADTDAMEETAETDEPETEQETSRTYLSEEDIKIESTIDNSLDGGHALEASGETVSLSNALITKTGDSEGDEADFYGENAAIYAQDGAVLDLSDLVIKTDGTHANAVFSYGSGTTVNISDSVIYTSGNCSGGLMTTGGGTTNAENLTIHTTGNSSAAIRSDRGGGSVSVNGGSYTADGKGSPVIYSTADITMSDAEMTSTSAPGAVVEGKNSITLNNCVLTAENVSKNSDKSDTYQAVMIYQSMSGDAAEGEASFTMNGGTLVNKNGDIFFVNNTIASITLNSAEIINESDGVFLRAAAAGWGREGSNGGHVTMHAAKQEIEGDIIVDGVSSLNLYLENGSSFTGSIENEGEVYVELSGGSTWTLTADTSITSLSCDVNSINLNGHKLYVNGEEYQEGTASSGEAIEVEISAMGGGMPEGAPPQMPGGEGGHGPGGEPPEKPEGGHGPGGEPPAKP